jgi:hypothetical protein
MPRTRMNKVGKYKGAEKGQSYKTSALAGSS